MKTAKSVNVNWLSFARIKHFTEPLGQHFGGHILQHERQNKKYSLPGLGDTAAIICHLKRTSCRGFEVTQVDEDRQISRCELAVLCPFINFHRAYRPIFRRQYSAKKRQNKKYSLPGLGGLGFCNLSLESDVLPFLRSDSSGQRPRNQSM